MKKYILITLIITNCFVFLQVARAESDAVITLGKITSIMSQQIQAVEGTSIQVVLQELEVKILEGSFKGRVVDVENDISPLKVGDRVHLALSTDSMGNPQIDDISFVGVYRLPALGWLTVFFVFLVLVFGGWPGVRGLVSLVGSLALILFTLLPGLLHGWSPIGLSIGVSVLIIVIGSYITHGFNRTTTAAIIGMILTISIVGVFALYVVHATRLSGMESEETLYLSAGVYGDNINLLGLLLGGILIGLLGILYDIAIGQAIAVEELRRASPHMHTQELFKRAIRIGREHIGALVNTLAIAYVGVSLPLLLLFYSGDSSIWRTLNNEIFATEIVRILIGSIGLVIAAPITTLTAVAMLKNTIFSKMSSQSH